MLNHQHETDAPCYSSSGACPLNPCEVAQAKTSVTNYNLLCAKWFWFLHSRSFCLQYVRSLKISLYFSCIFSFMWNILSTFALDFKYQDNFLFIIN